MSDEEEEDGAGKMMEELARQRENLDADK